MANSYFQFKQFRIEQNQCAMKVCTDSCLFGAYIPVETAKSIIDIGTGTGLLALMAAQRSSAIIKAIEIDETAALQAAGNFAASPWAQRLQVIPGSLQDWSAVNTQTFDLILCNPPFYLASQKSPDAGRNRAMHISELSFEDILQFTHRFLNPTGSLHILLPPAEAKWFMDQAVSFGLFLQDYLLIYTREGGKHIRSIMHFTRNNGAATVTKTICIRQEDQKYTPDFIKLLQPYYLIF